MSAPIPTPTRPNPLHAESGPETRWTTTNIAEAFPGVLTALTWTLWNPASEIGSRRAYAEMGILRSEEVQIPEVDQRISASFFGRPALNVDTIRFIADRAPGTSGEAAERQLLGTARPDLDAGGDRWRAAVVAIRAPIVALREPRRMRDFLAEQHEWWREQVSAPRQPPRELLHDAAHRLEESQWHHAICSILAITVLERLAELTSSVDRAELYTQLATGLGGLDEQLFLAAIWELSRGRLDLAQVIDQFGYEGPGELSEPSCRVDPHQLEQIAKRYREMPEENAPARGAERQAAERSAAISELMKALPARRRPGARVLNRCAQTYIPLREAGKASYVMALDAARAAATRLGAELCAAGKLNDPRDAFLLTLAELTGPAQDYRMLADERRAQREAYSKIELPVTWTGQPKPIARQDRRAGDRPTRLEGIGVFTGVIEAPAKVARTISEARTIQAGEILVCNTTDPSWAAVFPLAAGLAIDIGSHASHGAIVARELGLPCVINTGTGTEVINDGDMIRIDGTEGTVELVEAAS